MAYTWFIKDLSFPNALSKLINNTIPIKLCSKCTKNHKTQFLKKNQKNFGQFHRTSVHN